jgi:hypothetical protein
MYLEFIFIFFLSLEATVTSTLSAVGPGWAESSAGRAAFVYQFLIGAGKQAHGKVPGDLKRRVNTHQRVPLL